MAKTRANKQTVKSLGGFTAHKVKHYDSKATRREPSERARKAKVAKQLAAVGTDAARGTTVAVVVPAQYAKPRKNAISKLGKMFEDAAPSRRR